MMDECVVYKNLGYRWGYASVFCLIIAVSSAVFVMDNPLWVFVPIAFVVLAVKMNRKGSDTEDLAEPLYVIDKRGIKYCKEQLFGPDLVSWESFLEARAKTRYPGGIQYVQLVLRGANGKQQFREMSALEARMSSQELTRVINEVARSYCK